MAPLLAKLHTLQLPDGTAAKVPTELREFLRQTGLEALKDNLKDVATGFGLRARWEPWRYLRKMPELPHEFQQWLGKAGPLPSAPSSGT